MNEGVRESVKNAKEYYTERERESDVFYAMVRGERWW